MTEIQNPSRVRKSMWEMLKQMPPEASQVFDATAGIFLSHTQLIHHREKIGKRLYNLNIAEIKTLVILKACQKLTDITHSELKHETNLTSGGQTKVLKSLQDKGYIDVAANPGDARSKWISINQEGLKVVDKMFPEVVVADHDFYTKRLTDKEFTELKRLLRKLVIDT